MAAQMVKVSNVNGTEFSMEMGHTEYEWKNIYGNDEDLWSFPIEELLDGTIEPNSSMLYWFIDERAYETDIAA